MFGKTNSNQQRVAAGAIDLKSLVLIIDNQSNESVKDLTFANRS